MNICCRATFKIVLCSLMRLKTLGLFRLDREELSSIFFPYLSFKKSNCQDSACLAIRANNRRHLVHSHSCWSARRRLGPSAECLTFLIFIRAASVLQIEDSDDIAILLRAPGFLNYAWQVAAAAALLTSRVSFRCTIFPCYPPTSALDGAVMQCQCKTRSSCMPRCIIWLELKPNVV